ncbi:MAG: hypothetical protein Q8K75_09690 [Chlamydiales bacterium]|nr:hypothetical protein [Chlamydiales bacterium]
MTTPLDRSSEGASFIDQVKSYVEDIHIDKETVEELSQQTVIIAVAVAILLAPISVPLITLGLGALLATHLKDFNKLLDDLWNPKETNGKALAAFALLMTSIVLPTPVAALIGLRAGAALRQYAE